MVVVSPKKEYIQCSECKEIYIGSTKAFNTRNSQHRGNI